MRIVGGTYRGKSLASPPTGDKQLRPTSDRLRETVFNILAHGEHTDCLSGARVLDLFAGTGALGFEALSRGAKFVLFVDDAPMARGLIRQNVDALGAGGTTRLFRRDATQLGDANSFGEYSLIFADPPYGRGLAETALVNCRDGGWLADGAVIIVEESVEAGFAAPPGFVEWDRRRQGKSEVVFLYHPGDAARSVPLHPRA
jgi:16S rRNA (guanine966-N2)-methyltransferase